MKKSQDIDLKKGINYSQILQWLYIPLKKTGLLNVPLCMLSEVETTVLFNFSLFIMEAEKERERDSVTLVNYNGDHLYSTYENTQY